MYCRAAYRQWEERILAATVALRRRDLCLHLGEPVPQTSAGEIPTMAELKTIGACFGSTGLAGRLYQQAAELYIRSRVEPFQAVFASWMNGAKAQVGGQAIPFPDVIRWCQDTGDTEARRLMAREVRSLCRFLAPLNRGSWVALLSVLTDQMGYPDYPQYCEEKRGRPLESSLELAREFLRRSGPVYRSRMVPWLKSVTGLAMDQATRFDAIYMLGLRHLDPLFPKQANVPDILCFFNALGLTVAGNQGLHVHAEGQSGRQSYCVPVEIPGEIHVIVGPLGGWLDLEALGHELGHAASLLYVDPALSPSKKDFFPSGALSEAFAFLFQRVFMSRPFLEDGLGLDKSAAVQVSRAHDIKWLALARRYAAKLVVQILNFRAGRLRSGEALYSRIMHEESGFLYEPETYLFDLMPDFYDMDYFHAFLGAECLAAHLAGTIGPNWPFDPAAGSVLRGWWARGNEADLIDFLESSLHRPLECGPFLSSICPEAAAALNDQ